MTEILLKSQSIAGSLIVLATGSRAHMKCPGTLGLFILMANSHFRDKVKLVPKNQGDKIINLTFQGKKGSWSWILTHPDQERQQYKHIWHNKNNSVNEIFSVIVFVVFIGNWVFQIKSRKIIQNAVQVLSFLAKKSPKSKVVTRWKLAHFFHCNYIIPTPPSPHPLIITSYNLGWAY